MLCIETRALEWNFSGTEPPKTIKQTKELQNEL